MAVLATVLIGPPECPLELDLELGLLALELALLDLELALLDLLVLLDLELALLDLLALPDLLELDLLADPRARPLDRLLELELLLFVCGILAFPFEANVNSDRPPSVPWSAGTHLAGA